MTARTLITAAAVADAFTIAAPGSILIEGDGIVAAGSPQEIGGVAAEVTRIDRPDAVVTPALVNAHAHLDLSHIGPMPYTGDFRSWVDVVRARRRIDDNAICAAVRLGADLSRHGGTAAVGDIAGISSLAAVEALRESDLEGVSFVEVFGHGMRQARAVDRLRAIANETPHEEGRVRLGLSPHAPYSCGVEVFRAAATLGLPLCTHLAETLEELRFVRHGDGPLADLLREIGVWDDSIVGAGLHPVDLLAEVLESAPMLAVHLNYLDGEHLERMAPWPMSVAYCPRASAYFGHPQEGHPGHRYRDMLDAGINVALGTDSLICLDTPDRISVLDEMRFLSRRDATDAKRLLAMATVNGARALGLEPSRFMLRPGAVAGLLAVHVGADQSDPVQAMLNRSDAPEWLVHPGR